LKKETDIIIYNSLILASFSTSDNEKQMEEIKNKIDKSIDEKKPEEAHQAMEEARDLIKNEYGQTQVSVQETNSGSSSGQTHSR
jgi:hypothetical protein